MYLLPCFFHDGVLLLMVMMMMRMRMMIMVMVMLMFLLMLDGDVEDDGGDDGFVDFHGNCI